MTEPHVEEIRLTGSYGKKQKGAWSQPNKEEFLTLRTVSEKGGSDLPTPRGIRQLVAIVVEIQARDGVWVRYLFRVFVPLENPQDSIYDFGYKPAQPSVLQAHRPRGTCRH